MLEPTVQIPHHTDRQSPERVGDLRVRREPESREVVDHVPGEGNDQHRRHLLPFTLVDDDEAESKGRDEDEGEPRRSRRAARNRRCSIRIDPAVERGSNRDAIAKEERIYDGVHHANRASQDIARLQLESTAYYIRQQMLLLLMHPENLRTVYPGRIRAMADCASAEKQNTSPFLIEPKARARKLVSTAAVTSKMLE